MITTRISRIPAGLAAAALAVSLTACHSDDSDQAADGSDFNASASSDAGEVTSTETPGPDDSEGPSGPNPTGSPDSDSGSSGGDPAAGAGASDSDDRADRVERDPNNRSHDTGVDVAGAKPATSVGSLGGEDMAVFTTPSENITCAAGTTLRCDIISMKKENPRDPSSVVIENGAADFRVTNDAGPYAEVTLGGTSPQVIGYGESVSYGAFACTSTEAMLICEDVNTTHGAAMAREGVQVF